MNSHYYEKYFKKYEIVDENKYPKLYEDLELSLQCSSVDIKNAYRRLALEHHPDKGGSKEKMWKIRFAYDVLSDPDKKFMYDTTGSASHIDDTAYAYKIFKITSSYISVWFRMWVETKLNLKDIVIEYATNSDKTSKAKLGLYHVGGFNFVHHFVEDRISKSLKTTKLNINNFVAEIVATIVAAPFELAAYKAFQAGFSIIYLRNYFNFDLSGDFNFLSLFKSNIISYKDLFKSSWRHILGMVAFRIGFNLLQYFFISLSDYANHRYLLSKEKELMEEFENTNNNNNEITPTESMGSKRWLLLSRLGTAASYIVPPMLFSVHRLFYKLGNQKPYFGKDLIRSGLVDGIFTFGLDQFIIFTQQSTTRVLNGLRGIFSMFINNNVNNKK